MYRQIRSIAVLLSILIVIVFIIFVVNQTAGIVSLAASLNETFGKAVLVALLSIYLVIVLIPFAIFLRMPRAIRPPEDGEKSPEYDAFIARLEKRLSRNPLLAEADITRGDLSDDEYVRKAFELLDRKANELITATASTVFLGTAISQSGRLDAVMVLGAQTRLIWQIAHIYNQRPSLRELLQLYANVAATTFLVSRIEEMDISEKLEPVILSAIGPTFAGAIPGVNTAANLALDSIVVGSANAFLTLRVGVISRKYFTSLQKPRRSALAKSATLEATPMLASVITRSAGIVVGAIWSISKKGAKKPIEAIGDASRKTPGVMDRVAHRSARKVRNFVRGDRKKGENRG